MGGVDEVRRAVIPINSFHQIMTTSSPQKATRSPMTMKRGGPSNSLLSVTSIRPSICLSFVKLGRSFCQFSILECALLARNFPVIDSPPPASNLRTDVPSTEIGRTIPVSPASYQKCPSSALNEREDELHAQSAEIQAVWMRCEATWSRKVINATPFQSFASFILAK